MFSYSLFNWWKFHIIAKFLMKSLVITLHDIELAIFKRVEHALFKNSRSVIKKAHYDEIRKELLEKTDVLYDKLSEAVKKGLSE